MKNKKLALRAKGVAALGLSVALIAVCAQISVPLGRVPVTLQTFAVAFAGALFGFKRGVGSVFLYLFMGLIGIPVFSGFGAGPAALFGPTGGYLFGFLFLSLFPALLKRLPVKSGAKRAGLFFAGSVLGLILCYAFGTVWFLIVFKTSLISALSMCVLPFLLPDMLKLGLASVLAARLEKFAR